MPGSEVRPELDALGAAEKEDTESVGSVGASEEGEVFEVDSIEVLAPVDGCKSSVVG